MKICVLGLWHLGSVTAACLASLGHRVVGVDFDEERVGSLSQGTAPVFEAGLEELLRRALATGQLRFSPPSGEAIQGAEVLWIAYDTPLDDDDNAQTDSVITQIERILPCLDAGTWVLVSSQLPVGSVRRLERAAALHSPGKTLRFASSPENLRLGSAVSDFLHPDRIVVGINSESDETFLQNLLSPISRSIEWMSIESAEMTKHALNAFLASSVVFANEIASICESVGADAKEVERGLKSDRRIGPGAYLAPGAAFAGGTLARDVAFVEQTARERGIITPLLSAIPVSNAAHKLWAQVKLRALFPDLARRTIAVWGLSYKPGTDTLRRSIAVELCDWLLSEGATIRVHDPMVKHLPEKWTRAVTRCDDPIAAVDGANALVIATAWPTYRSITIDQLTPSSDELVVLDANRFVPQLAAATSRVKYFAVGMPGKVR